MCVLCTVEDPESTQAIARELVLRNHTFDGVFKRNARVFLDDFLKF